MAPIPVLFLRVLFPFIKIAMLSARFTFPLHVEASLMVVPPMIVVVVRVIHAVAGARSTARDCYLRNQGGGELERANQTISMAHVFGSPLIVREERYVRI